MTELNCTDPGGTSGKEPPANAGYIKDMDLIPGQEDPQEEKMATHSNVLDWRIPWTEEPGRLQSSSVQSLSHVQLFATP